MCEKITIKKSFLESGKDFRITQSVIVKHPTLDEVLNIDKEYNGYFSEDLYYSWVNIFICDPYDYMVYLDDKKIDYETMDTFGLFILMFQEMTEKYMELQENNINEDHDEDFKNNPYFQAFKFFLNKEDFIIAKDENGEIVIADYESKTVFMDNEIFNRASEFIKQINGICNGMRINPEDDFAKKILIEDERDRLKKLSKSSHEHVEINRLGNLISAITWCNNSGITPFNRGNLHMYDLIDGIQRSDKLLNYNHTMTGIYSGCVDKDKVDMQKISWQL